MADNNELDPPKKTQVQGGQLGNTFPGGGVGKPSDDQPVLPSRQPVNIPTDFPRKRR